MLCLYCKREIPPERAVTARYCNTKCRSGAYRQRKREPPNEGGPSASIPLPTETKPAQDSVQAAAVLDELKRLMNDGVERIVRAIEGTSMQSQRAARTKVDLRQQVLSQSPAQAAGYRLVLPARQGSIMPLFAPRRG